MPEIVNYVAKRQEQVIEQAKSTGRHVDVGYRMPSTYAQQYVHDFWLCQLTCAEPSMKEMWSASLMTGSVEPASSFSRYLLQHVLDLTPAQPHNHDFATNAGVISRSAYLKYVSHAVAVSLTGHRANLQDTEDVPSDIVCLVGSVVLPLSNMA